MKMNFPIWFELPRPWSPEEAEGLALRATALLAKLGKPGLRFEFDASRARWRLIQIESDTSIELSDDGHWFDLDSLVDVGH